MKSEKQYIDLFTNAHEMICEHSSPVMNQVRAVSYTHLRAHET